MTENMITNSSIFKPFKNEKTFLLGVSQKLRYQIFCPWDMVVDKAAMRREMCFMMHGSAEVISRAANKNIVVLKNIEEGDCFGEEILFKKMDPNSPKKGSSSPRIKSSTGSDAIAELRSKTMSEVWFLGWKGFLSLQSEFPSQFEEAYNKGTELFQGGKSAGNKDGKESQESQARKDDDARKRGCSHKDAKGFRA